MTEIEYVEEIFEWEQITGVENIPRPFFLP